MSLNAPPLQYARTTDGVNIAFFSIGERRPIVFASNIFGDAHLYGLGWPHVRFITDKLLPTFELRRKKLDGSYVPLEGRQARMSLDWSLGKPIERDVHHVV